MNKVWLLFGGANFITIVSTNVVDAIRDPQNEWYNKRRLQKYNHNASHTDKFLNIFGNCTVGGVMLISTIIACSLKGSVYALSGPVGTYRMLLAINNKNVTNDHLWTKVVFGLGLYSKSYTKNYITWPFGFASWYPLTKE